MSLHSHLQGSARNCCRCGKELTDAASMEAGIGPICRKLDNAVLATMIEADRQAALAAWKQINKDNLPDPTVATVGKVGADLLLGTETKDWRKTVKRVEWILSWNPHTAARQALLGVVESLGYVGLVSVIKGEAAKGLTTVTFENGRLYMQGPNNKAGREALKQIKGRQFHAKTAEQKARWSVPASEWVAFQTVIVKHWVNHTGLVEAVQAAQSYKPEPTPVEKPKTNVIVTESSDGWLKVKTPYNQAFIAALKGAFYYKTRKWNPSEKVWEVTLAHEAELLSLIETHYGVTVEVQ